jgi:hypothetical protein
MSLALRWIGTPRMLRIGLPYRYAMHGTRVWLHEEIGFTPEQIAERVEAAVLDPRRPPSSLDSSVSAGARAGRGG